YTGSDGLFEFNDLDAIQYTVSVQANGYATDRKTITVIAGELQRVNFALRNN
ncbi:MAG: carboxypeptidase regulatory-like domain-containing protein, partial [Bacteroidales bacterium]|nr:carboxypeptidase regulatory-like domain-containing protein [Bacteroidales bacterium]